MPPNKHKIEDKPDKGKKQIAGIKGKPGSFQGFGIPNPNAVKPAILPPDAPALPVPKSATLTGFKKWCLKNTQVLRPVVEKSIVKGRARKLLSTVEEAARPVNKHKVVNILNQKLSTTWSAVQYESIAFELIDPIKRIRGWVTTRVTGWVQNDHMDDFFSAYPDPEVVIPHATPDSTDPQQYMTLEIDEQEKKFKDVIRHNMCGELSVAFVANRNIDTVLRDWKAKPGGFFKDRLGMGKDTTLGPFHIKDILDLYFPGRDGRDVEPYVSLAGDKIPLAEPGVIYRASDEFRSKIKTHDFITLVRIDLNTGELIPIASINDRNHWVVVTRVMRGGYRVELYNPFPNRRQAYSFYAFNSATGANVLSGWWVGRKKSNSERPFTGPEYGVATNNPTSSTIDADQYVFIEGGTKPKTRLCGEFCTAFIIGASQGTSLENWSTRQKTNPAGLWELTNILDAYGFNNKEGKRLFSIDTLLRYWRRIQPNLYASTVGGETNEGTDFLDLMSILRAYGYKREDLSLARPGGASEPFLFSPGRDAKPLKKYFLIAGVIVNGSTGRLKNRESGGVEHWVVVDSIIPEGNQFGGGGGWVEIYNPFPNRWEEYTLSEFAKSFNGGTLWVKRDITPVFAPEAPAPRKVKVKPGLVVKSGKGGKTKAAQGSPLLGTQEIAMEFNRLMKQPKAVFGDVIRMLVNRSGLSRGEIIRLVGLDKNIDKTGMDVQKLLCDHLGVKSIPETVTAWIFGRAGGNETFAIQVADTLLRAGILRVKDKECVLVKPARFKFSENAKPPAARPLLTSTRVLQDRHTMLDQLGERITVDVTGKAAHPFFKTAVGELKATQKKISDKRIMNQLIARAKPVLAIQPREEYLEWIKTLEAGSDRLYRVRRWGDPVMIKLGFDIEGDNQDVDAPKGKAHFQAVGLYNKLTGFGAITNHVDILREDIDNLLQMQFEEEFNGKTISPGSKMKWLCAHRGKIYMYDDESQSWETASQIRWGTIALGGNLVQVDRFEDIETKLPGGGKGIHRMGRLAGFHKKDWSRPVDELVAEGLVHRCFCVYKKNQFGDIPNKGVAFSPLFSPQEWGFNGNKELNALYIPEVYLEPKAPQE